MKSFLISCFIISLPALLHAQITINTADLPSAGSMYGVTNENASASVDFMSTGANHTWDFTSLTAASTSIDTFFTLAQLPADFQTYFVGADMADNAGASIAGFTLQGAYTAYNKNALGFYNRGFGGTIPIVGLTLPFIYIPGDQMVKFPLNFSDADVSTTSAISGVPNVISITRIRNRTNTVDGWGTLQLPSGNYQVLRMKSDINDHDSVNIVFPPVNNAIDNLTHEYKWYAAAGGIPVLQINTNETGGNETVTQIIYQDPSLVPDAVQYISSENSEINIYPNPASDYAFVMPAEKNQIEKMLITDVSGRVLNENLISSTAVTTIDLTRFSEGIYFVRIINDGKFSSAQKLIVNR